MKIECTKKRELEGKDGQGRTAKIGPGTLIPMGDQVYAFKPENGDAIAPHVCEVSDPDHIARFKDIPDSFKPASGNWPKALPESTDAKPKKGKK